MSDYILSEEEWETIRKLYRLAYSKTCSYGSPGSQADYWFTPGDIERASNGKLSEDDQIIKDAWLLLKKAKGQGDNPHATGMWDI
jgi:hypothetical protein